MPHCITQLPLFVLERVCTDCGETKPLERFSKGNAAYGRKSYCKSCQAKRSQAYRARILEQEYAPALEKYCPQCKQTLPASEFYVSRGQKSGLQSYCRRCQDGHNLEWLLEHRDQVRKYRSVHHQQHWQRYRNLAKQWRKNNRLRDREYFYRYYGRKRGTQVGRVDYAAILERDGGTCYLCGLPIPDGDLHFDHVIPLSRGGAHTMENIRATHKRCNLSKSDKTPEEFLHATG